MKFLKCECGWVHFGVSKSDAENEVKLFNEYYDSLDKERQDKYYGGKPASIETYLHCFRCGKDYKKCVDASPDDIPEGSTIQPIMYEEI